ncbi:MAG: element excision factor XisH family protein [Bacteroidota bacterium]
MARDKFHSEVRNALETLGWDVTKDPLYLKVGRIPVHIDLGAEKLIGAEKNGTRIAIEVKTFGNVSFITAFYEAVGKYIVYRKALSLSKNDNDRKLYLAMPEDVYIEFSDEPVVAGVLEDENVHLILYDADQKIIKKWIE